MEFILTSSPESVVAREREKVENELKKLLLEIEAETQRAKGLAEAKANTIAKIAKRKDIQNRHDVSVQRAEQVLRNARLRAMTSQAKLAALESSISESMIAVKRVKKLKSKVQKRSAEAKAHLDSLGGILDGIIRVRPLIDVDQPVTQLPNKMKWVTSPVQIFDKSGELLPTDFGRFRVTLSKDVSGNFSATMLALEPVVRNTDFVHPHVRSDGNPCLGNASNQLLTALNQNDLQGAIMLVHNFLTHYNIADPYTSITWWEPNALWHMPECECGLTTADNCGCASCTTCGIVFREDGGSTDPAACGLCASCCSSTHHRNRDASRITIPGSNCVHTHAN